MQTVKKPSERSKIKEKTKDDNFTPRKSKEDEKLKKTVNNVATPKNYLQKTSTVDIYGQKKKAIVPNTRAPKKVGTTHTSNNVTPMKDILKSSPSSVSQLSVKSQLTSRSGYDKKPKIGAPKKVLAKASSDSAMKVPSTPKSTKTLPFSSVTVNSPVAKRKLNMGEQNDSKKTNDFAKSLERGDSKEIGLGDRQRTTTRTLDENEVKVLKTENVDNNSEMLNLSKKLSAKPQAFFIDLDGGTEKSKPKSSDEETYEDDFESYESDFDSYRSENSTRSSENTQTESDNNVSDGHENDSDIDIDQRPQTEAFKEGKDDEMLDSGNFDLRDQRSANRRPAMEYILEDREDDKRASLTDEGFQDMSSSSAVSSMRTQVDILDRPLFIDFTKAKENKRKRKLNDRLKQRASDLLNIITLHEMAFTLFEMKSIPYDLYMATFGRSNYTQIAVQTFDDGITEEVQTEEILFDHKWTQHPIEFSKHDVCLYPNLNTNKYGKSEEDFLTKFTFLVNNKSAVDINNKTNLDKDYKENPLRIYFEQKDGVGSCEMLPYETYKTKMETCDYDVARLRKFLKKAERRLNNILNTDDKELNDLTRTSKLPFSKGYVSVTPKTVTNEELSFLKFTKISNLIFSQTKSNLLLSVHKKCISKIVEKCIICLWDVSVARREPVKVLIAINHVTIGRFRGSTDGIFVAALEDGSIHLWDLSEEPTWWNDVASGEKATNLVEVSSHQMSQTEMDREWNLKNRNVVTEEQPLKNALQACAYTSSGANMEGCDVIDCVVGLEFVGEGRPVPQEGGRKVLGQICSLQRMGIITLWSIIQEKKNVDIGKAFWSKMKLEKIQVINILDHIDIPINNKEGSKNFVDFNLNAAKRRLSNRKIKKTRSKKDSTRPKSTSSSEFDISRPASAASAKKVLPVEKKSYQSWESGVVCCDLKVTRMKKVEQYLIAKNCGEVLWCSRHVGSVKINKFCVAADRSTVTCLEVSPHGLPYFLAATDSGTVNLFSMLDSRVLLTLDCRNGPPSEVQEKCQADSKGRFISSASARTPHSHNVDDRTDCKLSIKSLHWSHSNPCSIYSLLRDGSLAAWDLMRSDINAQSVTARAASVCASGDGVLALLTAEGEIQIHRLSSEERNGHFLDLFQKYVTLL